MSKMYMVVLVDETTFGGQRPRGEDIIVEKTFVKNRPKQVYCDKAIAIEAAGQEAIRHPTKPVYVFESVLVIETQKPTLMRKEFNEREELLPVG